MPWMPAPDELAQFRAIVYSTLPPDAPSVGLIWISQTGRFIDTQGVFL